MEPSGVNGAYKPGTCYRKGKVRMEAYDRKSLLLPFGTERVDDVSAATFSNGRVEKPDGSVLIFQGGSYARSYVARSTVGKFVDCCLHTPNDSLKTRRSIDQRLALVRANKKVPG